jgi:hypothetical protein
MRFEIDDRAIYVDGLFLCYVGAGNGCSTIRSGYYPLEATYSHAHRKNLVRADGLGWVGASAEHDIVVGRVRNRDDVIPCQSFERRIFALVEAATEAGQRAELVVK